MALHYEGGTATALAALHPALDHLADSLGQAGSGAAAAAQADVAALLAQSEQLPGGSGGGGQRQAGKEGRGGLVKRGDSVKPLRLLSPGDRASVRVELALPPQAVHTLLQVGGARPGSRPSVLRPLLQLERGCPAFWVQPRHACILGCPTGFPRPAPPPPPPAGDGRAAHRGRAAAGAPVSHLAGCAAVLCRALVALGGVAPVPAALGGR